MTDVKFFYEDPIDLQKLADTFKLSFSKGVGVDWLNWRFLQNPNSDKAYIAYIEDGDKIVSCCTGTPYKLHLKDKGDFKFVHTHTGFTHPDYQGQGLFARTIESLFYKLKEHGYIGEINFCNHNSHASYRNIPERVELSILNFFQTDNNLFRKHLLKDFSKSIQFSEGDINPEILESASKMNFNTGKVNFSRDFETLKWRFYLIPNKKYKYVSVNRDNISIGILIFKQFDDIVDLMEFFFDPNVEKDRYKLLGSCVNYLIDSGKNKINYWSNLHSREHVELEKFGFQETIFSTYFGVIRFQDIDEIAHYPNWHYRLMDSDVF